MVDVVYTWVDGSDARWLEKKNSALSLVDPEAASRSSSAVSDSRFCNRDELKYSLRSLEKFAGFVTRIHIVTDHQIPSWLDTAHPDIQLVSHEAIFANADDLPTFNSHAIEANLHRIESLSERYIYLNDDFTFYAPCGESDFFDSSGRAVIYFDHRKVVRRPWCFGYDSPVNAAARNNSRLLESLAFSPITHRLDHVPYALRKSVIEELWEKFPDQLEKTSSHKFRHPDDLSVASSLAQHYALATNRAIPGPLSSNEYIKVKKTPLSGHLISYRLQRLRRSKGQRRKFMSINDAGKLDDSEKTQTAIAVFLESTFPDKSQFEL